MAGQTGGGDCTTSANALKGFVAGGVAGVISKTTVAPMDRVKLILQLQNSTTIQLIDGPSTSSAPHTLDAKQSMKRFWGARGGTTATVTGNYYSGIVDCFRRVCAEQGFASLWRGNAATVARCFPHNALNLAFRDFFRDIFVADMNRRMHPWRFAFGNLMAGGTGAAVTLCFLYPLDYARTRLAVDGIVGAAPIRTSATGAAVQHRGGRQFNGVVHCLRETYQRERGVRGLYRGLCASLYFAVASRAVFFGIFDTARAALAEDHLKRQLTFAMNWSLAQASIIVSSVACYPLDTVRRRLMLESGNAVKQYDNFADCFNKILQQEGYAAFYKGALSNSLRCTSGALILAVYYELIKYI